MTPLRERPPAVDVRDTAPSPTPFAFGPARRRLFGWYHATAAGAQRSLSVVLCKPIGYESMCVHSSYRYLAEQLAGAGCPVVRFDYDGTGDSFGSDEDPDRVQTWIASIGYAIDALREKSGNEDIALFGVRLGATLAAVAASERGDVKSLALWATCWNGRSYLREIRALYGANSQSQRDNENTATRGYIEAAGFIFTPSTVEALSKLDICSIDRAPAASIRLMDRDDMPSDGRYGTRLAELGADVNQSIGIGYATMMQEPISTVVPVKTIESLVEWMSSAPLTTSDEHSSKILMSASSDELVVADAYTETSILRGSDNRSFGILTRPTSITSFRRTAVFLLSVGTDVHVGPNRMYTDIAREMAELGLASFRLDIVGVGDSARGAAPERYNIYSSTAIDDIREAMTCLSSRFGYEHFVVVGLCSGAYLALEVASSDRRVSGQILINQLAFEWKKNDSIDTRLRLGYKSTRFYIKAVISPVVIKRALTGKVNVRGICRSLLRRTAAHLRRIVAGSVSVIRGCGLYETEACRAFRSISDRGANTLMIYSAEDRGLEIMQANLGTHARKMRGKDNFRLEILAGADHLFTQTAIRKKMLASVVQHLIDTCD